MYLIIVGIGVGFVVYVVIKVVCGKMVLVYMFMWVMVVLFVVYFVIDLIK